MEKEIWRLIDAYTIEFEVETNINTIDLLFHNSYLSKNF